MAGSIVINGPASLPYDIDLGPFPLTDYYYKTADELVEFTKTNGPPASDNVLFNGTNVHPVTGAGKYAVVNLTPGKRHRLRIINNSVENHFQVYVSCLAFMPVIALLTSLKVTGEPFYDSDCQ